MASQKSSLQPSSRATTKEVSPRYHRIVVKAGTSLLTRGSDQLDRETMETVVGQIARLHQRGAEIMLVSSGAVAAGRHVLGVSHDGKNLPLRQVLAAVGQSRLMRVYEQLFDGHSIPVAQALISRRDITDRLGYLNVRNTLLGLLDHGVVPVINENDVVAVEELTGEVFGDNDTLSGMVANLIDADLLVILGDVEGLFTADPHLHPSARLISIVEQLGEEIESMGGPSWGDSGRGGMATKLEAARLATASGVNVVIASGVEPDVLTRLDDGESIGTFFPTTNTKMESRKRWMLTGLSNRGEIVVDDGAVCALSHQNRSLLPAGVVEVLGVFQRGDIISILASSKTQIACGIANYNSVEMAKIKGFHSERIGELLGHQYSEEVVHRNNMVIL